MLIVENLSVEIEGKEILKGVDLHIPAGETHVLFGPNGIGKSSLLYAIMGFPKYKIKKGKIYFKGKDITHLPTYERAKLGLGMAFQKPPAIKGVKLNQIAQLIAGNGDEKVREYARLLKLENLLERDLNYGFSGGEMKKAEIFQLIIQNPDLSLIDEPESGVDVENIEIIAKALKKLLEKDKHILERKKSGIIITHTGLILEHLTADRGHLLLDGRIICSGNPEEMFKLIKKKGYQECLKCWKL